MSTSKKVEETIKNKAGRFSEVKTDGYEQATKRFDKLVNKGLIKKRGNQLISSDKAHISKWTFNKLSQ